MWEQRENIIDFDLKNSLNFDCMKVFSSNCFDEAKFLYIYIYIGSLPIL